MIQYCGGISSTLAARITGKESTIVNTKRSGSLFLLMIKQAAAILLCLLLFAAAFPISAFAQSDGKAKTVRVGWF